MRISDWSSDVCSSDLARMAAVTRRDRHGCVDRAEDPRDRRAGDPGRGLLRGLGTQAARMDARAPRTDVRGSWRLPGFRGRVQAAVQGSHPADQRAPGAVHPRPADHAGARIRRVGRSEEHTSELQSLMRTSYAVFCLKKTTKSTHVTRSKQHSTTNKV